ncbi:MAG: alpha-L-fucosidase [Bacteroidetes bacterium]|nr:MAG: alpha-L-fucosidase [Bacteroidota bacterium]
MKKITVVLSCLLFALQVFAQNYTPSPDNLKAREWFGNAKFGLFIHWGPFSIPGSGEWVMQVRNISVKNYTNLKDFFNPIEFNAAEWVSMAKNAGMKYITLITRHHDGFSMWDTKFSDFNIMNTPYHKDIVKMLADECHKQGVGLFFYYSLLDWRRDDYSYWTGNTGHGTGRTVHGRWEDYIQFMKNQLTELLTNYGEIAGIWFDGYWDQLDNDNHDNPKPRVDWHFRELYDLIHKLQPKCLVGNNHHITPLPGEDFQMFEKDLPGNNTTGFGGASVSALPLETCETMNNSWGYNITDVSYKSVRTLVHYIVNAAAHNANFLLNVGPMPSGKIQMEFQDTLRAMGKWMKLYGETVYGTRGNIIPPQEWGVVTVKDKLIYAHLLKRTGSNYIFIPGVQQKITSAVLLNDKRTLKFKQQPEGVFIYTEGITWDDIDTIVQLQ